MRPWIVITSIVAVCAIAASAWAEPNRGKKHQQKGKDPARVIKWLEHHPDKAAELGVTEDQLNQVKDLLYQAKKNSIQMRADAETAQLNVRQLLDSDTPDKVAVMAAVDNAGAMRTELHKAMIGTHLDVRNVLGSDTLSKVRQAAGQQMRARHGDRERKKGDRPERRNQRPSAKEQTQSDEEGPAWMQDQMTADPGDLDKEGV